MFWKASLAKQQSYRSRFRAPAALVAFLIFLNLAQPTRRIAVLFFLTFCKNAQSLDDVLRPMAFDTLEIDRTMSNPESLLEPLPTLNVVANAEKLDAGLRGLDHCELLLQKL